MYISVYTICVYIYRLYVRICAYQYAVIRKRAFSLFVHCCCWKTCCLPFIGHSCRFHPHHRVPVPGMETHIPVLFLDLNGNGAPLPHSQSHPAVTSPSVLSPRPAEDFHQSCPSALLAGGLDAALGDEDDDEFFDLHIVKHFDPEVKSSIVRLTQPLSL